MANTGLSLTYNGVEMTMLQTRSHDRQPVSNGPDFLATQFELHVVATVHPDTISPFQAKTAVSMDTIIRHRLMAPQGNLKMTYSASGGPVTLLEVYGPSAKGNLTRDEANGPVPLYCNIIQVVGTKSFIVQWGGRFTINEAEDNKPSALLSNRWVQEHVLSPTYFLDIITTGRAAFRTDLLWMKNISPDEFRLQLFVPLMAGYQREVKYVRLAQSNDAIEYQLVDHMIGMGCPDPQIAQVECFQRIETSMAPLSETVSRVWDTAAGGLQTIVGGLEGMSKDIRVNPFSGWSGMIGGVHGTVSSAAAAAVGRLPSTNLTVDVVVMGSPLCSIKKLVDTILPILAAKTNYGLVRLDFDQPGIKAAVELDYVRRIGHGSLTIMPDTVLAFFAQKGTSSDEIPEQLLKQIEANEEVPGKLVSGVSLKKDAPIAGKGEGNLVKLFAQLLSADPLSNAPKPNDPKAVQAAAVKAGWPNRST